MTEATRLTALEMLDDHSVTANKAATVRRDRAETRKERDHVDMKSYRMGEAAAYLAARNLMEAELRRLCNRFQNGALSVGDFGIVL